MNKIKKIIFVSVILFALFFLFGPEVFPENIQFQESLNSASLNNVIVIFNSGGWGNTPPKEAKDLTPIVEGIEKTLSNFGYNSTVIPYERTKNSFLGKITSTKELTASFPKQSKELAQQLNYFLENNSGTKIVMVGLSNGAAFTDSTISNIPENIKEKVYAIEVGIPFWQKKFASENILRLDKPSDPLSEGKIRTLLFSFLKAPFKIFLAKVSGFNLSFSQAVQFPGHGYSWDSPEVGGKITSFLETKFAP